MGLQFDCEHVFPDCEGSVSGETEADVLQAAAQHAADVHGVEELPAEVVEKVKASIVPAS